MIANYATNIALIDRATNVVINVIWGMVYHEETFNTETQLAVVIDDLAVSIGDTYDGEAFYREGERVHSTAEMMADMQAALEALGVNVNG